MKVTIFNAISADGYISDINGETQWASEKDFDFFIKLVKQSKAILMGRKTFQASQSLFPFDCDLNIVITKNTTLISNSSKKALFTNKTPNLIISDLKKLNYNELLVIGGGQTNSLFLNSGLVDEIIIDVHPILLGKGTKFARELQSTVQLKLISSTHLDSQHIILKYQVK